MPLEEEIVFSTSPGNLITNKTHFLRDSLYLCIPVLVVLTGLSIGMQICRSFRINFFEIAVNMAECCKGYYY